MPTYREVRRFRARAEDGREVTIIESIGVVDVSAFEAPSATTDGLTRFQTNDGHPVNPLGDDRFEILAPLGEFIVRRT